MIYKIINWFKPRQSKHIPTIKELQAIKFKDELIDFKNQHLFNSMSVTRIL